MNALLKKAVSILMAAVLAVCILPQNIVHAENTENSMPDYLVLGDSISTGYGLTNPEAEGFTYLIADSLSFRQINKARAGFTSSDILAQIQNGELDNEIENAGVITISCGGNDLMAALYQGIADTYNAENGTNYTAEDVVASVTGNHETLDSDTFMATALEVIDGFTENQAFLDALAVYEANMFGEGGVMDYIRSKNEKAMVIIATQYNPYRSFRGVYITVNYGINAGVVKLNTSIQSHAEACNYVVTDVYATFTNSKTNLCNATTSPLNLDFHPNVTGHQKIAETVIGTIQKNCPAHINVNDVCTFCGKSLVVNVTGVTLNRTQVSVKQKESIALTATVKPEDAVNKNVTWSTDNPTVATVDSKGLVTAVGAGTAVITVTTENGNFKATCTVTVSKTSEENQSPENPPIQGEQLPTVGTKITDAKKKGIYKVTSVKGTRGTVAYAAPVNEKKSTVSIPASIKVKGVTYTVTGIEKNAFKNNKNIRKVTIGKNVRTIGKDAFRNCKKLKSIVIQSKGLKTSKIGKNAFKGVKVTVTIKVPKSKLKTYRKMLKKKGISRKAAFEVS